MSELEDKVEKNTVSQQQKEKRLKRNEDSLRVLQDNMKCSITHIIGIPEGERSKRKKTILKM